MRPRSRHLPLLLIPALAGAVEALAAEIVVAPGGSDGGAGSFASPLASVREAVRRASPGDTIWLRGGTYRNEEGAWIGPEKSGKEGAPLRIHAYPGETPELVGSRDDCLTIGADWVEVTGITCRDSGWNGIILWGASHARIIGNRILGAGQNGIPSFRSEIGPARDNVIERNEVAYTMRNNSSRGKRMSAGGWGQGISGGGDRNVIRDNYVHHTWGEGIGISGSGGVVSGNRVETSFSVGIYVDGARNVLVERNFVFEQGDPGFLRSLDGGKTWSRPAGIQVANEVRPASEGPINDVVVRNNVVVGASSGIHYGEYAAGGGMRAARIVHNTVVDPVRAALHLDTAAHRDVVIAGNAFVRRDRGALVVAWTTAGVSFRSNAWYGTGVGPAAGPGDVTADPRLRGGPATDPASQTPTLVSPLLDRADQNVAPPIDFAGRSRRRGLAPDIGAFEVR